MGKYERAVDDLMRAARGAWVSSGGRQPDLREAMDRVEAAREARRPSGPTVRVRVAVAVAADGTWCASGASDLDDATTRFDALGEMVESTGPRTIHWVEADVPIPQVTVEGEVSDGEGHEQE